MKLKEARSAVDWVRDSSTSDITVVSLFLLPILLGAWSVFLNGVAYLDNHGAVRGLILLVLLVAYIIGIIVMKVSEKDDDRLTRAKIHTRNRLQRRDNKIGSFDYLRKEIDSTYSDEFLCKVIDRFPHELRKVGIKGQKNGMGLVKEEAQREPNGRG